MEMQEGTMSDGDQGSSKFSEDGRSCTRVVQGLSKQPTWTSHRVLKEEMDE